jgi:hypothetical protein
LRIRVKLDLDKPLTRVVYVLVGNGNREAFRVKYEKLPKFCAVCGLLGHIESECAGGMHDKKNFQYEYWLIASSKNKGKMKGSKSASSTDTKGYYSREPSKFSFQKRNSEPKSGGSSQRDSSGDEAELRDDVRSPLKGVDGEDQKSNGREDRKCLSFGKTEKQVSDNMAWTLVPASSKKGLVTSCVNKGVSFVAWYRSK